MSGLAIPQAPLGELADELRDWIQYKTAGAAMLAELALGQHATEPQRDAAAWLLHDVATIGQAAGRFLLAIEKGEPAGEAARLALAYLVEEPIGKEINRLEAMADLLVMTPPGSHSGYIDDVKLEIAERLRREIAKLAEAA